MRLDGRRCDRCGKSFFLPEGGAEVVWYEGRAPDGAGSSQSVYETKDLCVACLALLARMVGRWEFVRDTGADPAKACAALKAFCERGAK